MNSRDKLMMEIYKSLEVIRNAEMDFPQQFTLRALACAVIKAVADAEGKSIEEVLEDREVKRMIGEEAMKILAKFWAQGDEEDKLTADELFAIQEVCKYIRDYNWHEIKSVASLPPLFTEVLTVDCEGKYRVMTLEYHEQYESWKGNGASGVNAMVEFRFRCKETGEETHADDILAWKPIEEYEPKKARSGAVWSKSRDYRDEKNEDGWIEHYGEEEK